MKTFTFLINKKIGLMLLGFILTGTSYGAIFTAVASGNYSNSTTWSGGIAPPATLVLDQVIIPAAFTVAMDNNVTLNGALAQLSVDGSLNSAGNSLTVTLGTLTGAGTIAANTVNINIGGTFSLTGTLIATTLNVGAPVSTTADITVGQTLNLTSGALALAAGGSLDMGPNGTIVLSGGTLNTAGGTVGLTGNYNVSYINVSTIAGAELSGSGLQNVTVNTNAINTVTLTADLTIGGTLALTSGVLTLGGNDLTLNGGVAASGTGTVASTSASNISINTTGGTAGTLTFSGAGAAVNNLTVNVGTGNQTHIGGTVIINGTLQLNSGTLTFDNANLTISGNVSGAGALSGNVASNLTINTVGGLPSAVNFATGGQSIHDFSITVGAGNSVLLGSDLSVNGILALTGNLNLNGNALTLAAASSMSGTGTLTGSSTSDLTINSIGGISALSITGPIRNFTVNTGVSNVTSGSGITVVGLLSLQSGSLILNANNLTINGTVAASGTGTISSTIASDITVATSASPTGSLNFSSSANSVGNLIVNVGGNGVVGIGSDLNVNDTLSFIVGKVNIAGNALILGAAGVLNGAGASSYIITTAGGYLERLVSTTSVDSTNFPVGTALQFAPANIRLNAGSSSGQVQVGVVGNVLSEGTTGVDLSVSQHVVDATWDVHSLITGTLNLDLEVLWSAAMEVNGFNRNAAYLSHYVNGNWDSNGVSAAVAEAGSMYSMHRNGLTSLSPFSVFDNTTISAVNEINNDLTFAVYPNPATDNLIIQNTAASVEPVNMDIFNAAGQLIGNYKLTNATTAISVKEIVSGTYFIKFYNNNMSATKSFVKM